MLACAWHVRRTTGYVRACLLTPLWLFLSHNKGPRSQPAAGRATTPPHPLLSSASIKGLWRGIIAACAYDLTLRVLMPRICLLTENIIDYVVGPMPKE